MKKQVLCFGEILWDAFGDGKQAGGAPMNVAIHLQKQGTNVHMASRVGNDHSGRELISFLHQNNLNTELVQIDEDLPTCEVTVQLDTNGHATYIIPEPVAWDNIQLDENLLTYAKNADVIVFGSLACRNGTTRSTLFSLLEESRALRVLDVNLRAPHYNLDIIETMAAMANVVKMNEEEADLLIGSSDASLKDKIIEFQHKYHTQTICVTRGENGAIIWHNEDFFEHPGFKVQVADTVGAGDSFLATLVNGLIGAKPIDQVLEKACTIGSYVASKRGANPDYDDDVLIKLGV